MLDAWGVIVCTQEAAKQMIAQGTGGKIINTGSIASRQGFWDFVPYCVWPSSALSLSRRRPRAGLIEHGITVNAFAPGVRRHSDVGRAQRGHPRNPCPGPPTRIR